MSPAASPAVAALRDLIAQMAPGELSEVSAEHRLVEDLGYDSLTLIELAVAIEERFALAPISEEEAMRIKTVGDLEHYIVDTAGQVSDGAR